MSGIDCRRIDFGIAGVGFSKANEAAGQLIFQKTIRGNLMEIQIKLDKHDWQAFQQHLCKRAASSNPFFSGRFLTTVVAWAVVGALLTASFRYFSMQIHKPTMLIMLGLFLVIAFAQAYNSQRLRKAFEPVEDGVFYSAARLTFSPIGIASEGADVSAKFAWPVVSRIERTDEIIMLFMDSAHALLVPIRCLDDPEAFFRYITETHAAAVGKTRD